MTALSSDSIQPSAIRIPQVGYHPSKAVVAIALGSNLGNPEKHIEAGLTSLQQHVAITLLQVSPCFWTEPVYWEESPQEPFPAYLNGVILLLTTLSPVQLMQVLLEVENNQGRRREARWASRTLDLDILLWEKTVVNLPEVIVPHPRLTERPFVLVPLQRVVPHWIVPGVELTVEELATQVGTSGVEMDAPLEIALPPAGPLHC